MATQQIQEVVKPSEPEQEARLSKEGKPFREQRRNKIADLPAEVREELDEKLANDSFRNYRWLSRWLEEVHSARISPSALNYRKKHKIDAKLLPVKYATQEARDIVKATGGDNEEINRVLTMLVQTKIFEMLIQMNSVIEAFDQVERASRRSKNIRTARAKRKGEANGTGAAQQVEDPRYALKTALMAVNTLTRNTTEIGEHVRKAERWEFERDDLMRQISAASQKVSKLANEAGLSAAAEKSIRDALMEIKL